MYLGHSRTRKIHAQMHTNTRTHTPTHTHPLTYTTTHRPTHPPTHPGTYTHTHMHMHTRTDTHSHTYAHYTRTHKYRPEKSTDNRPRGIHPPRERERDWECLEDGVSEGSRHEQVNILTVSF